MNKQKDPQFKVGDVVCVLQPTMAVNMKKNEESKKFDFEENMLLGDEGLIVTEIEFIKRTKEYLYHVLTENSLSAKVYSLAEDTLTLYEQENQ